MGRTSALITGAVALFLSCGEAPSAPVEALIGGPQETQNPPPETATATTGNLPARISIGGIRSIDCASVVVYSAAPDVPHRLNATYAFPQRTRWWLGLGDEASPERQMRFCYGDALYAVDRQGGTSRELLAEEHAEAHVQLEMRRALLLWPLGFEWKRTGVESSSSLPNTGRLVAHFADETAQNPDSLSFFALDGRPGDEFRALTWRTDQGKAWPTNLELWHEHELVWTETVRSIDTRTRFIDSFFLPPDRRDIGSSKPLEVGALRSTDLTECRVQRLALEPNLTLTAALEAWARITREQGALLAPRGFALDDKVTIEISRTAQPAAILLRLAPTTRGLPEDLAKAFEIVRERPALTTFVIGVQNVAEAEVKKLYGGVPADATGGTPYVRLDPKKPDQHVLIVLPLVAGEK